MRKTYVKPELTMLHLRPEEKIAMCYWPVTHMTGEPGSTCGKYTWADLSEYSNLCKSMYNNAEISGS
jgi:hypothetical protein